MSFNLNVSQQQQLQQQQLQQQQQHPPQSGKIMQISQFIAEQSPAAAGGAAGSHEDLVCTSVMMIDGILRIV